MSGMHGARREIRKLRLKLGERDFRGGAPPLDQDGLPRWDDAEPLTIESYMRAMGFPPDAELTNAELAARQRLSPYAEVFQQLQRDATEKEAAVK